MPWPTRDGRQDAIKRALFSLKDDSSSPKQIIALSDAILNELCADIGWQRVQFALLRILAVGIGPKLVQYAGCGHGM